MTGAFHFREKNILLYERMKDLLKPKVVAHYGLINY